MDKLIPLNKGIHRQPSVGADGELSELVNLVPVNGELKNVRGLDKWCALPAKALHAEEVVCIHKVGKFGNVICLADYSKRLLCLPYESEAQELDGLFFANVTDFKSITSVGNTLIVSDAERIRYFVWKDNAYTELNISGAGFTMTIETNPSDTNMSKGIYNKLLPYDKTVYPSPDDDSNLTFSPEQLNNIYIKSDAYVNERISEMDKPEEWHKYVTFGIAALRLYDDTYITCSDIFTLDPQINMMRSYIRGKSTMSNDDTHAVQTVLSKYKATINTDAIDGYIITGIDIYLTQPYSFIETSKERTVKHKKDSDSIKPDENLFVYMEKKKIDEIMSSMVFRKAHSIYKSDFNSSGICTFVIKKPLGVEDELNLSDIHNKSISAGEMMSYNGRLNLTSLDESLVSMRRARCIQKVAQPSSFKDVFPSGIENAFWGGGYYGLVDIDNYNGEEPSIKHYDGEADIVIKVSISDPEYGSIEDWYYEEGAYYPLPPVFSYPSIYVTRVDVYMRYNNVIYHCYFTPHHMLNGNISYYFFREYIYVQYGWWGDEMEDSDFEERLSTAKSHDRRLGRNNNILRYSGYGNPFVLPAVNSIETGNETILGLSNATTALSKDQFGHLPLYVFCTDGIWALEVNDDGSYKSVTPVSRDVCNNPDSITQIDGAVVFTTDQGLMMMQGSEVVNLSGAMEGFNVDESDYFPDGFFDSYDKGDFDDLVITETRDFREILRTCKIAYDYVNKMLRIFPIGKNLKGKYYVFSLESREFATVYLLGWNGANINVVADYPSSIIQINDKLYRPSETDDNENTKKGLLLTRPIMLDEPFALKKLQDMRLHYSKFDDTSKCHVVVYVSNDGTNWAPMRSLRKRSYKYYRFAIITDMKDMDALSGMVLRYEVERNNKLR